MCIPAMARGGSQILLEPELQAIESHPLWVLGTEPRSSLYKSSMCAYLVGHLSPDMDILLNGDGTSISAEGSARAEEIKNSEKFLQMSPVQS